MRGRACPGGWQRGIFNRLLMVSLIGCLLVIGGCATLPTPVPVRSDEAESVRQVFKTMLHDQSQCPAVIDADITVTVENLLWSGTLSGYLRAMAPDYLRFEGVNPLGLTEAILVVDGEMFSYLSVRDQQVYSGPLTAKVLSRYAPDGLATSMSYYWLMGRMAPGSIGVGEVGLDRDGQGYWLDLYYAATGRQTKILFNPERHLVNRYLLLNGHGAISADLSYEYSSSQPTTVGAEQGQSLSPVACQLPVKIIIFRPGNGRMTLAFNKRYPTSSLDTAQFRLTPPPGYKRIEVQ